MGGCFPPSLICGARERAATTLVTQQGQTAAQAAAVVDILSPEQAEQIASPPTLLVDVEEPLLEDTATGSAVPTGGWGSEALGIGSPTSPARRSHTPPPELDDFHFVSYLGSGGSSDVYVYEEQLPRRLVAIKVLSKNALGGGRRLAFPRRSGPHGATVRAPVGGAHSRRRYRPLDSPTW